VPTIIHSDPFRIHQILTNLIGNAIKFTDKGYVYLQVALGEIKDAESSIKFTVADTGIGMSSTDKDKLFKAFTQADTSITRRFGGTGLGLVISRKLTMLMHGEIGFDSTEGEGSTFWFSVPVIPKPAELKQSELGDKNIAFISNHFIAKQAYKTLFENWDCQVDAYPLKNLNNLSDIENSNDILVFFLSLQEVESSNVAEDLGRLNFSKPSMLIASTRSHSELRNLQQHNFDSAVFTSEKTEIIKQKLINTINKKTQDDDTDVIDDTATASIDWSNINILVVDDNDINLRLAEIILHRHKARVTTARSGAQAIDYASMNSYDIIFMDLHMPGLDGYETAQKIRETTPGKQPVIIALTANAMPQEKDKVIQSSMNGLLIKPVSNSILQKVVRQWVLKESIKTPEINEADDTAPDQDTDVDSIFSIKLAKEFTGNNEELAYELFGMLRGELDNYKNGIADAVQNNSLVDLREQVHKLHGASRCCGTTELKQVSSHIETLINQNINFDIEHETGLLLTAIQNVADYEIE
jgi:two-component system sensor histidine kinase BarA